VVTGAGRGIGREVARLLSARGYAVLVTDVNEDAARETAEMLGEHAWHLGQDVRDPDRHREVAQEALESRQLLLLRRCRWLLPSGPFSAS